MQKEQTGLKLLRVMLPMMQTIMMMVPRPYPTREKAIGSARIPVPITLLSIDAEDGMIAIVRGCGDLKPPVESSERSLTEPRRVDFSVRSGSFESPIVSYGQRQRDPRAAFLFEATLWHRTNCSGCVRPCLLSLTVNRCPQIFKWNWSN